MSRDEQHTHPVVRDRQGSHGNCKTELRTMLKYLRKCATYVNDFLAYPWADGAIAN